MILQACLNGARPEGFHPRLPTTPDAILSDSIAAVEAGANELHVHVRGSAGNETLAPEAVDSLMRAVRAELPGTLIGVSTGAWIEKDDHRRLTYIDGWHQLPDYASVNLSEQDAPAVFERLARRNIGVEAGIATADDAQRFVRLGLADATFRILIEIDEPDLAAAHSGADRIMDVLAEAGIRKPILIHGIDGTAWSFVERAADGRLSTRVGLEDCATLPDGRTAESNSALVAAAADILARRGPNTEGH